MRQIKTEDQAEYSTPASAQDQAIIAQALELLSARQLNTPILNSAKCVAEHLKDFLRLKVNDTIEHFYLLSLDSRLRIIASDCISDGNVKEAYVHPRAVAETALKRGASAVVLAHNHPSGHLRPSQADTQLTQQLVSMFKLMDINVLDHVIVTYESSYSFAENGILPNS